MTFSVKHDFSNLLVKLIQWILQTLLQLICYEVRLCGPSLKTLSDKVMSKPFKLLIGFLHLVILSVE